MYLYRRVSLVRTYHLGIYSRDCLILLNMTLESQVVSLPLAKRLKELGVKQESVFGWLLYNSGESEIVHFYDGVIIPPTNFAAFTVAELGEILSDGMVGSRKTGYGDWACVYVPCTGDGTDVEHEVKGMTEADARAQMLSYLLQNKLLATNP